jgi:hypothetical protein
LLDSPPLPNGVTRLRLVGQAGYTFAVLASTNLIEWELLSKLRGSGMAEDVLDPQATGLSERFYRAVVEP